MVTADPADTGSDTTTPNDPSDPSPDLPPTPQWYPPGTSVHRWRLTGGLTDAGNDDSGDLVFTGSTNWTTDPITLDQALSMIHGTIASDDGSGEIDYTFPDDYTFLDPGPADQYVNGFWVHGITSAGAEIRLDDNIGVNNGSYSDGDWFLGRQDVVPADDPPPDTQGTWTPTGTPPGKPYVSISGTAGTGDDADKATFTVSRYGDTSDDLTVNLFAPAGSATDQVVSGMPSNVTIHSGQDSASFDVTTASTIATPLPLIVILKASSSYWLTDALLAEATTQALPNKAAWQKAVLKKANIDFDNWIPSNSFTQNRVIVQKVYAYYAQAFNSQPQKLLWAGMAKLAGGAVFNGLSALQAKIDQNTAIYNSIDPNDPALVEWRAYIWSLLIDENLTKTLFLQMHQAIWNDLAWQHEAYLDGGIAEIQRLHDAGEPTIDANVLQAWKDIDSGDPTKVKAGNEALLDREQRTILPPFYAQLGAIRGTLIGWATYATYGIMPGTRSFAAVEGNTANIADTATRWNWITTDLLPVWEGLTDAQRAQLVNAPLGSQVQP